MRSSLGSALSVNQRLAVKASLNKLKVNEDNSNISFWGKISGSGKDYLIAVGSSVTESISKVFYVSHDDGLSFSKLPAVDDFIKEKAKNVRTMFTGSPSFLHKDPAVPKANGEEEEEEPEEEDPDKPVDPSKRKLTELERLAHTVESIDADTCVTPRGSFVLTPTGTVAKNNSFEGLSPVNATDIKNFLLFRDPRSSKTLARVRKLGVANNFDFLDSLTDSHPEGAIVLQADESGTSVSVRSLVWPGYEFTLETSTHNFGGAYFGYGLKNEDVLFMV